MALQLICFIKCKATILPSMCNLSITSNHKWDKGQAPQLNQPGFASSSGQEVLITITSKGLGVGTGHQKIIKTPHPWF